MKQQPVIKASVNTNQLLFLTAVFLLTACTASYKNLKPIPYKDDNCVLQFKPNFTRALYNAQVNVLSTHLSGLLLIKLMPDSSTRLLFSTETGFKFFDFEFDKSGNFKVHYILDKMKKKAVINTLRNDFELALMTNIEKHPRELYKKDSLFYHRYTNEDLFDYYITDSSCSQLIRIEKASKRKIKMDMIMQHYHNKMPDTIGITHHNFRFNIGLKRLETENIDSSKTK